jgi:internalin A
LEKLNAAGEGITSLVGLEYFTLLTELDLDSNLLEDMEIIPNVLTDVLTPLGPNPVTDPPVLTQLTKLDLKDNMIRHLAVFGIPSAFPQLSELDLENNKISDISPLAELLALEKLELDRNLISNLAVFASLIPDAFLQLSNLDLGKNNISDISHLAGLTRLEELDLDNNMIIVLTPLAPNLATEAPGLIQLIELDLDNNLIESISDLAELTKLTKLDLSDNMIIDLAVFATAGKFPHLSDLDLENNLIIDISPLKNPTGLFAGLGLGDTIDLRNNPLGTDQCLHIQALIDTGATVRHEVTCP